MTKVTGCKSAFQLKALFVRMDSAEIAETIQVFPDRLVSQRRMASPSVYIHQVDIDRQRRGEKLN